MTDLSDYIRVVHDPLERKLRGRIADLEARHAQTVEALTHPRALEKEALTLADNAAMVDRHIMDNGLAFRRDALRYQIEVVRDMVRRDRAVRAALAAATDSQQAGTA